MSTASPAPQSDGMTLRAVSPIEGAKPKHKQIVDDEDVPSAITNVVVAGRAKPVRAAAAKAAPREKGGKPGRVLSQKERELKDSARVAAAGEVNIPQRRADAMPGSKVMEVVAAAAPGDRERILVRELSRGNVPSFLRQLVPVHMKGESGEAIVSVMPDYLAVGSDTDYVRVPLSRYAAAQIARTWGFVLPTTRIVDAIYDQADVRVKPAPLPAGDSMVSVPYLLRHERMVQNGIGANRLGQLVAGQKKDVVLSNKVAQQPHRLAIYGWHQADASPIQPLSDAHAASYYDYSHGVRLVSATVLIDGVRRSIYDVLADANLAPLLSKEGRVENARRQMSASLAH